MKSIFPFFFLFLCVCFAACNDDEAGPGGGDNGDFFEATIDGAAYRATGAEAYATIFSADNSIAIYGTGTPGTAVYPILFLSFEDGFDGQEGTYAMGLGENAFGTYTNSGGEFTFGTASTNPAATGTVTISARTDERVAGTFSFTAIDLVDGTTTVEVTDGKFDVGIQ